MMNKNFYEDLKAETTKNNIAESWLNSEDKLAKTRRLMGFESSSGSNNSSNNVADVYSKVMDKKIQYDMMKNVINQDIEPKKEEVKPKTFADVIQEMFVKDPVSATKFLKDIDEGSLSKLQMITGNANFGASFPLMNSNKKEEQTPLKDTVDAFVKMMELSKNNTKEAPVVEPKKDTLEIMLPFFTTLLANNNKPQPVVAPKTDNSQKLMMEMLSKQVEMAQVQADSLRSENAQMQKTQLAMMTSILNEKIAENSQQPNAIEQLKSMKNSFEQLSGLGLYNNGQSKEVSYEMAKLQNDQERWRIENKTKSESSSRVSDLIAESVNTLIENVAPNLGSNVGNHVSDFVNNKVNRQQQQPQPQPQQQYQQPQQQYVEEQPHINPVVEQPMVVQDQFEESKDPFSFVDDTPVNLVELGSPNNSAMEI